MDTFDLDFFVAYNEDGACLFDCDESEAVERLQDEHGGMFIQTVHIKLRVPAPQQMEVSIEVEAAKRVPPEVVS